MNPIRTALLMLGVLLFAGACAPRNVELPTNDGDGADEMRASPCACVQLDYDGRGYEWLG